MNSKAGPTWAWEATTPAVYAIFRSGRGAQSSHPSVCPFSHAHMSVRPTPPPVLFKIFQVSRAACARQRALLAATARAGGLSEPTHGRSLVRSARMNGERRDGERKRGRSGEGEGEGEEEGEQGEQGQ